MHPVLYSHRLKSVLQHTVRDLGLTLVLADHRSDLNLAEVEAMIGETAQLMNIKIDIQRSDEGTTVTFYQ